MSATPVLGPWKSSSACSLRSTVLLSRRLRNVGPGAMVLMSTRLFFFWRWSPCRRSALSSQSLISTWYSILHDARNLSIFGAVLRSCEVYLQMQSLGRARDAYCAVHELLRVPKQTCRIVLTCAGTCAGMHANEDAQRDRRIHQRMFARQLVYIVPSSAGPRVLLCVIC